MGLFHNLFIPPVAVTFRPSLLFHCAPIVQPVRKDRLPGRRSTTSWGREIGFQLGLTARQVGTVGLMAELI
jgi:hypothetical protein